MEIRYKKLLSNTFLFAVGSIGSKIILFMLVPLYTNYLSTETYGNADLIVTFSSLFVPVFSLGIGEAVLRFGLSKEYDKCTILQNALLVNVAGSMVAIVIYFCTTFFISLDRNYLFLLIITLLTMFRTTFQYYVKAENNNKVFALDSIIHTILLCVSNIVFIVFMKKDIIGYLSSFVIADFSSIVYLLIFGVSSSFFKKRNKINYDLLKKMLVYSFPLIFNSISWWAFHSIDKLMLKYYISASAVGLYSIAAKIPSLVNTLTYFFTQAWTLSAISEYDNNRELKYYSNVFKFFNVFLWCTVSFVLIILRWFMGIYVGKDFASSFVYVPFLLVAALFQNYSNFFAPFFSSARKTATVLISTVIGSICNIILNAILIPKMHILGAVFATLIAHMIISTYRIITSRKILALELSPALMVLNISLLIMQAFLLIKGINAYFIFFVLCSVNIKTILKLIRAMFVVWRVK